MVIVCVGCYLFVEEEMFEGVRLNNFVGYLELGEMFVEVVVCEVLEEIVWVFVLEVFFGVYLVCFVWLV